MGERCAMRRDYAVREYQQWYVGDGVYGDGPHFHWDYYNSFVIHPMLVDVLRNISGHARKRAAGGCAGEGQAIRGDPGAADFAGGDVSGGGPLDLLIAAAPSTCWRRWRCWANLPGSV